ncbi:MAG: hypothetical protein H0T89_08210 [Deltaproteobacteria bacterium]|nr:hypothetical protein [Deltaproteobacteria bacterium]MDQ3295149.1 cytochrome c family protein [Myxococcota bacterium]
MLVVVALAGCKPDQAPVRDDTAVGSSSGDAMVADARPIGAVATIDAAPAKLFVNGAGRCGECHEKMFDEWERSGHANAASSALYKTAQAAANDPTCDRCHAPIAIAAPHDVVAQEGVTCDVCHTLREPVPSVAGGAFRLAIDDMVKYGPRCDLPDHYFHRMGCSKEHRQAELCGSCHWWEPAGIPVFTEYRDWRDSPAGKANRPCQSCHMPGDRAVVATGSPARKGVPHHGFMGRELRRHALELRVTLSDREGGLEVAIELHNLGDGHTVPTGLPERRIEVVVHVTDAAGGVLHDERAEYGRVLADATGNEVAFWRATQVLRDSRIPASGSVRWPVAVTAPAAGRVRVEVVYRGVARAIAQQLALRDVETVPLLSADVAFEAPRRGVRATLPRTRIVKPPGPGAR